MGLLQVRLAGDRYVLVEYGPMELDLNLRVRIWALQAHLADAKVRPVERRLTPAAPLTGIVQIPGVNAGCVHGGTACHWNAHPWAPCRHEAVLCSTPADSLSLQHRTMQRSS